MSRLGKIDPSSYAEPGKFQLEFKNLLLLILILLL